MDNLTPIEIYTGRAKEILAKRIEIKKRTLQTRRLQIRVKSNDNVTEAEFLKAQSVEV
jgi:hypothetical protein